MDAFGKRLRVFRLAKGFTQERLANECDFPPSHISRIETGDVNTSLSHIARIAKVLDVPLNELMDLQI